MSTATKISLAASLYSADGVTRAIAMFEDFGAFEWSGDASGSYFEVGVTAGEDVDLSELVGEFGNAALAESVRPSDAVAAG